MSKSLFSLSRSLLLGAVLLAGAEIADAQTMGSIVRLSTLPGSSIGARVAADGTNVHVVWVEGISSTNAGIYYRKSADSGVTWSAPLVVAANLTTATPLAMIAAKGNTVVVAWTTAYSSGNASGGLYVSRSSDAGGNFSAGQLVAPRAEVDAIVRPLSGLSGATNSYIRPSSALIDSSGRIHIGFYGGPNIGQSLHKMSCDGGATWLSSGLISVGDRGNDSEAPRLFEQNGVIHAVYRSSLDGVPIEGWPPFSVRVSRMTAPNCASLSPSVWMGPSQVVSGTGYSNMANTYGANVSSGPSGVHLSYWNEASGGANVVYRSRSNAAYWSAESDITSDAPGFGANHLEHDGGAAEFGESKVSEGVSGQLHLAVARTDRASDSFNQYPNQLSRVFYRFSANSGATWTPVVAVNDAADGFGVDSAVSGSKAHLVWSSTAFSAAGGAEIVYRNVDVSTLSQVVASVGNVSFASTSVGGTTNTAVTFTNISGATLNGMTVAISGAGFSITSSTCSASVPASGTCSVSLAFAPTASGPRTGSLTLSGGGLSAPVILTVSGTTGFDTIIHYYTNILSRAPDAGGEAFWRSEAVRLQGKGASPVEAYIAMATNFFASGEYQAFNRSDADFIEDLYKTFFNRASDAGGKNFWLSQIAGGLPRGNVLNAFMFSTEFSTFMAANVGTVAMRAEIAAVIDFYRGALSRLPEDSGLVFWSNQLRAAQCAPAAQKAGLVYSTTLAITSAFFDGGEYSGRNRGNPQFVSDLYNAFFRASGDLAGVNFWINSLGNQSKTRPQERTDFVNAPQYAARVNAITSEPCAVNLQ